MTDLANKKILILDCQTTGMHPSTGYLLQIAWCLFDPYHPQPHIEKRTLQLPEGQSVPQRIKTILRLEDSDLDHSLAPYRVYHELQEIIHAISPNPIVIAHYAQFEKAFLKELYRQHAAQSHLNFNLLCTQKIAKRLLPNLPSHNLKAMAGHFKLKNTCKNDVSSHVLMTFHIWQQLLPLLADNAILSFSSLDEWLLKKALTKPSSYRYNIDRLLRLELSTRPGVYQFLGVDGDILYIGKATSLKSRVNSYFRGIKNRDKRKLEMVAQIWDIKTIECDTALEAALLESDEIKKCNPPYNVLLKTGARRIIFYSEDYSQYSTIKCSTFFKGPYKPNDAVTLLIEFIIAFKMGANVIFMGDEISSNTLEVAWQHFAELYHIDLQQLKTYSLRHFFLIGYHLLIAFEKTHGKYAFADWWSKEKKKNLEGNLSTEHQLAAKLARMFIRAAETHRKAICFRRLLNASFIMNPSQKQIHFKNGEWVRESTKSQPSNELDILQYDRLAILFSAKNKRQITRIN